MFLNRFTVIFKRFTVFFKQVYRVLQTNGHIEFEKKTRYSVFKTGLQCMKRAYGVLNGFTVLEKRSTEFETVLQSLKRVYSV